MSEDRILKNAADETKRKGIKGKTKEYMVLGYFTFRKYRIYANIPRIFFPEFSEEKLGCADYLKQMIPSRVKE